MRDNPVVNRLLELTDEGEGVDAEPSDVDLLLHLGDLLLHDGEVRDLLVEDFEGRVTGSNALQDLGGHPVEAF